MNLVLRMFPFLTCDFGIVILVDFEDTNKLLLLLLLSDRDKIIVRVNSLISVIKYIQSLIAFTT